MKRRGVASCLHNWFTGVGDAAFTAEAASVRHVEIGE